MPTPISISDRTFFFERLSDWPNERSEYIRAWNLAFRRDGYEERINWLIGSQNNRTYLLRDEKRSIVAAYSLMRNRMVNSGSIVESALCNNVFCVPEYQGLNLFVRIGRLALADSASAYAFAYGLPNSGAIAGHKRVGWKFLDDAFVICIKLPTTAEPASLDGQSASPIQAELVDSNWRQEICKKMANIALSNAISSKKRLSIAKDEEYIKWRFFDRPKTPDRSYYVLTNGEAHMLLSVYHPRREINILDFQATSTKYESDLLRNLLSFANANNIRAMNLFGCSENRVVQDIKESLSLGNEDIQYEGIDVIATGLGEKRVGVEQSGLQCSMSFLDNDVY